MTAYELWRELGEILAESPHNHQLEVLVPHENYPREYWRAEVERKDVRGEIKNDGILESVDDAVVIVPNKKGYK